MKRNTKNIYCLLVVMFAVLGFSACTESLDYTPADKLASAQVYFSNVLPSTQELSKDGKSFTIDLKRINTSGALDVAISASGNDAGTYTIPTSVSFADGSDTAPITIAYDGSSLEYDVFTEITLKIADETYTTPYGSSEYSFKAGASAPWEYIGIGTFGETADGWCGEEFNEECKIYRNTVNTNQYKVEDPYLSYMGSSADGNGTDLVFTLLQPGDVVGKNDITITKSGLVGFEAFNMGYYYGEGYGDVWVRPASDFSKIGGNAVNESNLEGCYVSQYAADGVTPEIVTLSGYYYLPDYGGGWNMTTAECIKIVMPGVVIADYSVQVSDMGRFTDTKGTTNIVAKVLAGSDVEETRVALVAGSDEAAAYEAVVNGTVQYQTIESDSAALKFPVIESGKYTLVAVSYAGGEMKEYSTAVVKYTSLSEPQETWNVVGTGTYTFAAYFTGTSDGVKLYQSALDDTKYKLVDWCYEGSEFVFYWDKSTNRLTMDPDEPNTTGYSYSGYGDLVVTNASVFGSDYDDYYKCYYDPETKTFNFFAVYYYTEDSSSTTYYKYETFVLDGSSASNAKGIKASKKISKSSKAKAQKRKPLLRTMNNI